MLSSQAQSRNEHAARPSAAQWCIVVLLAAVATCLLVAVVQSLTPAALGQLPPAAPDGRGVVAVAGQLGPGAYGLYLVDTQRNAIMVYEYSQGPRKLYLRAARNYQYDRQLEDYNTELKPSEVADMVRQARPVQPAPAP